MNAPTASTYDSLPYTSRPFPQTLPDRVGAIASLFGMTPAPPAGARVLEIGGASGGNLLPMAVRWPKAHFVGIDLSARQIEDGKALVDELGLVNVDLRQMNLMDVEPSFGQFDYIIAHGVYSWVPPVVQDKLLAICRSNLAPHGVAYVSYNTNPGWRMRGMFRDMMVYHTRELTEITTRVEQSRALLGFLSRYIAADNDQFGHVLKREIDALQGMNDSYLAHEYLEDNNQPVYFHEFAEHAARHSLQYLGEAEFSTMLAANLPPEVAETLRGVATNIVHMEQYLDFLRKRPFRQTLLVHQDIRLNRNLDYRSVEGLHVASPMRADAPTADQGPSAPARYSVATGGGFATTDPIAKAMMGVLGERWPQAIAIADLRAQARSRLGAGTDATSATVADDTMRVNSDLLRCFASGLVELRMEAPPVSLALGDRPRADALARHQAGLGAMVTNLRHEMVSLDDLSRHLLRRLDGQHDRAALTDAIADLMVNGVLGIKQGGTLLRDPAEIRKVLANAIPQSLDRLARSALIAG